MRRYQIGQAKPQLAQLNCEKRFSQYAGYRLHMPATSSNRDNPRANSLDLCRIRGWIQSGRTSRTMHQYLSHSLKHIYEAAKTEIRR